MTQNELMHYGKKGMRWGKRMSGPSQAHLTTGKNVSDQAKSGVDAIRNTSGSVHRSNKGATAKTQASKMTDTQLKNKIQRMGLEQQYANLSSNNVSKGRVNLENTLSIAGGALAVTSSALGIALAIKQLKG